jgi:hypothetical protein
MLKVLALASLVFLYSITIIECKRSAPKQVVPMEAQIVHILNQMPKDTRVPIADRIKYAVHVYNKLVREDALKKKRFGILKKEQVEQQKKLERSQQLVEKFLAQKALFTPFLRDFNTNLF